MDKLFGRKNIDAIGDTNLKSFTVSYTIAYFHYLSNNRLDLWKIYEEQKTDDVLNSCFTKILFFVYKHLVTEANNSLISEYAKRESSWLKLRTTEYGENLIGFLSDYMISEEEKLKRENEKEIDTNNVEDTVFLISEIQKMGLKFWDGFRIYIDNNKQYEFDDMLNFDLLKKLKEQKNMTSREVAFGKKVLAFVESKPSLSEEIKSLSKFVDKEIIEIKFIYDKLLLLSKEEWKRIIDVAEQTKIFNNLELANVKSVQTSLLKKELVKEQALIKCHESLKKLKKFGIKV